MTRNRMPTTGGVSEPDPLPALRHAYRMRDEYQRAELRLNAQLKALQRRLGQVGFVTQTTYAEASLEGVGHRSPVTQAFSADPSLDALTAHLAEHRDALGHERKRWEKNIQALAKSLPVWPWVEATRGFGPLSFGQVIAETGDLSLYANPAKVWKRMGLAVIEGRAQRRVTDKALAEAMGFNPRRRRLMYIVADNLVKLNKDGYRSLYDERKLHEVTQHPELSRMHIHRRAGRYMAKRLLRDLWVEWRRQATPTLMPIDSELVASIPLDPPGHLSGPASADRGGSGRTEL
jgi:hypothetical protein